MVRRHITYANVAASLALFVALGGTSYAALKLPKDSVGQRELRKGAVASAELRDESVRVRDLSENALRLIDRGGRPGAWPLGQRTVFRYASVTGDGVITDGNATGVRRHPSFPGRYEVVFDRNVDRCVPMASPARAVAADGSGWRAAEAMAARAILGVVEVETYRDGQLADGSFSVLAACHPER